MRPRCSRCGASSPAATCPASAARGGFGGGQRGGAPATPPERTYFQEFGLKVDVRRSELDDRRSRTRRGALKKRDIQAGVDYQGMAAAAAAKSRSLTAPVVFVGYGIQEPSIQVRRAQGPQPQGQGRPDPDRSPRARRSQIALPDQEGTEGQSTSPRRRPAARPSGLHGAPAARAARSGSTRSPKSRSSARRPSSRSRTSATTSRHSAACRRPAPRQRRAADHQQAARLSLSIPGAPPAAAVRWAAARPTDDDHPRNGQRHPRADGQDDRRPEEADRNDQQARLHGPAGRRSTIEHDGQDVPRPGDQRHRHTSKVSDPNLKNEYFVVGAHFDHLGKRRIISTTARTTTARARSAS